ncbi:SDR family oxidoreductase [Salininema proteolyticum]|uniref:SDR family oxidoreductase n=1 Tax=Salininema proteolyticum TaxID=1607685 RepID=A0ABV8TSA3_9ACTN
MRFQDLHVVVNAAGRGFGRTAAIAFADEGAVVHLAARDEAKARATADAIQRRQGSGRAFAHRCDLTDPASVRAFAAAVGERTDRVDVLCNTGAMYLEAGDFLAASDEDVAATVGAAVTGTVLTAKAFLPMLRRSDRPDIVNLVSTAGTPGHFRSGAHEAFYAAKAGQGGFSRTLSHRLRGEGIRVIGLYPPDFDAVDIDGGEWDSTERHPHRNLTTQSVLETVFFAVGQPRDCFISAIEFEQAL